MHQMEIAGAENKAKEGERGTVLHGGRERPARGEALRTSAVGRWCVTRWAMQWSGLCMPGHVLGARDGYVPGTFREGTRRTRAQVTRGLEKGATTGGMTDHHRALLGRCGLCEIFQNHVL